MLIELYQGRNGLFVHVDGQFYRIGRTNSLTPGSFESQAERIAGQISSGEAIPYQGSSLYLAHTATYDMDAQRIVWDVWQDGPRLDFLASWMLLLGA